MVRPGGWKIWVYLDNSRAHNPQVGMAEIESLGLKKLVHPPYSPGLASSEVKRQSKGHSCTSVDDLKMPIVQFVMGFQQKC
jgi:hypothetical protein